MMTDLNLVPMLRMRSHIRLHGVMPQYRDNLCSECTKAGMVFVRFMKICFRAEDAF